MARIHTRHLSAFARMGAGYVAGAITVHACKRRYRAILGRERRQRSGNGRGSLARQSAHCARS